MKITPEHRTAHAYLTEFGPITSRDLADHLNMTSLAVAAKMRALVAGGYAEECAEWVQDASNQWVRQWKATDRQLPPIARPLAAVPDFDPEPERLSDAQLRRVAADAKKAATELADLFESAVQAGLAPVQVPEHGWRIAIAHPLGLPGRVWLDGPGDLEAVLLERSWSKGEHRAAA